MFQKLSKGAELELAKPTYVEEAVSDGWIASPHCARKLSSLIWKTRCSITRLTAAKH